jgi:4-aminobutyrate aminotransferase-like enzyme
VLRLLPPLVISEDDLDAVVAAIADTLKGNMHVA